MSSVREWRLHLGAHKTATTHLQHSLTRHREALAEQGVDYLPMEQVRRLGLFRHQGRRRWRVRLGGPMRRRIEALVAPLRLGPDRLAISEENFLGLSPDLLRGAFYPKAEWNLATFGSLSGGRRELRLFLSVRSFETLLPSAYVQTLRGMPFPGGFGPVKAATLNRPPSWAELAARIRRTLPQARLHLWTFEDYGAHDREILARFVGAEIPAGEPLPPPPSTRSPSSRAIAEMEKLEDGLGYLDRTRAAAEIAARDTERGGGERFAPFSDAERALLQEAYAEDLARIEADHPGTLLRLSEPELSQESSVGA